MRKITLATLIILSSSAGLLAQRGHVEGLIQAEGVKAIPPSPYYLVLTFVINKDQNGVALENMYPCSPASLNDYLMTWSMEYITVSGKTLRVKFQPPLMGISGMAMVPTEENGKGFRVFNPEGQLVGEQYFQPSEEPDFDLRKGDGKNYKNSIYLKGGIKKQFSRSVRVSWDSGKTWWGPWGEGITPTNELRLPEGKMKGNPHPYVELFLTSGLTVYRKMFIYDAKEN